MMKEEKSRNVISRDEAPAAAVVAEVAEAE
jgi:hypothetical protein